MSPDAVRANLERIRAEVGPDVTIVAATKYVPPEDLRVLADAGIEVVGENRAQDLERKHAAYGDAFRWHFIGHLQSNKAKVVNGICELVHSLGSESAATRLGAEVRRDGDARARLREFGDGVSDSGECILSSDPSDAGSRPVVTADTAGKWPLLEDRTADFSVNTSATQWPDGDLELARRFFKASLFNMFDRVEFIGEGIREVHGKKFVYFEFESRVNGNRAQEGMNDPVIRYTCMQLLIEPKRTLVFTFNCPRRLRPEWEETALAMMKSVKIR